MEDDAIVRAPVDPLAQPLLAAIEEAVVYVARADEPDSAREEAEAALNRLLDGLLAA